MGRGADTGMRRDGQPLNESAARPVSFVHDGGGDEIFSQSARVFGNGKNPQALFAGLYHQGGHEFWLHLVDAVHDGQRFADQGTAGTCL